MASTPVPCSSSLMAGRLGNRCPVHLEERVLDELEPLAVGTVEVER